MKQVEIFTDGACSGNPGPGGYGAVLRYGRSRREISGFQAHATNNFMELTAALEALRLLTEPYEVILYTDSKYLVDGITNYIHRWMENGWVTRDRSPVKNQELWQALFDASQAHQVTWRWVRAHDGHRENERADQLARKAIQKGVSSER
jgi:ribonuclease HI